MNALAEIFYIASGNGNAAALNIAVPTDVYVGRADTTGAAIQKSMKII